MRIKKLFYTRSSLGISARVEGSSPIIALLLSIGLASPALAVDHTWFGGNGDFGDSANWNPATVPGSGDKAILNAGTSTLSFGATVAAFDQGGGTSTLAGTGNLTVSGASIWTGGTQTGAATTQFDNTLAISGDTAKVISGNRVLNLTDTTTWSGNTGANSNAIRFATGTLNNNGTFNDQNAFASFLDHSSGTNAFNNVGTYNKQSNTVTTVEAVYNNSGTTNVNAGTMLMQGTSTSTGTFNIASGATLEFRNGTHTLNNATTSGLGTLAVTTENVGADAVVTINGGTHTSSFLLSGSTLTGTDQVFQGAATWTGGTLTAAVAASTTFASTLAISGATGKSLAGGRTLNAGNTTWSGNTGNNNTISLSAASTFNNTGTFTDSNSFNSSISAGGGGGGIFNNSGTFNKQSNTTTAVSVVFNNTGTVNVNAGTFLPGGGGTSTGLFNIADGAKLEFRNGKHTLNNVTTSGAGTFEISTENVGADAVVTLNGGTHTTPFVLSGSTLAGTDHTFQGPATWTGGTITGAVTASTTFANTLAISGATSKSLAGGRSLNAGNTTWSGNTGNNNTILISGASSFNSTGTFTDANTFDSSISRGNGGGIFNNSGTFNKQSNTTTALSVAFNNTGTVNVNAGTFLPGGGGTSTGLFNIADGAKLEFRNGNHTLNNVTTSGAGTFEISTENVGADAVVALNGGTHTTPVLLSGSTLTGTDHTFQGPATWTGGGISGAASTTFNNDVTISGPNLKTIVGGRVVNLNGTTTWSGNTANENNAIQFKNGATINNNGTFNDANAFDSFIEHNVGGPHNFNNVGTYNKQSNTTTTVDLGVTLNNPGTINVNAGTMRSVSGFTNTGLINAAAGATFAGTNPTFVNASTGTLAGNGTIATHLNGDVVNQGSIKPGTPPGISIGQLTIDGDLTQGATGSVNFDLASLVSFDHLAVTDDVTLRRQHRCLERRLRASHRR